MNNSHLCKDLANYLSRLFNIGLNKNYFQYTIACIVIRYKSTTPVWERPSNELLTAHWIDSWGFVALVVKRNGCEITNSISRSQALRTKSFFSVQFIINNDLLIDLQLNGWVFIFTISTLLYLANLSSLLFDTYNFLELRCV